MYAIRAFAPGPRAVGVVGDDGDARLERARLIGASNAPLSTTHTAMPSALALIAALNALIISPTSAFVEPAPRVLRVDERRRVRRAVLGRDEERVRRHVVDERELPLRVLREDVGGLGVGRGERRLGRGQGRDGQCGAADGQALQQRAAIHAAVLLVEPAALVVTHSVVPPCLGRAGARPPADRCRPIEISYDCIVKQAGGPTRAVGGEGVRLGRVGARAETAASAGYSAR